jgi:EmrB/QacA subfamily drug resistance transporter
MSEARRKRLVLAATILGSGVAFLDSTVVNVALPALRRDLGGGLAGQQWVVEAYLLALGSLVLVGGSLADVFGRRRIFRLGLVAFGIDSLLCAVSPTIGTLVAARVIQGVAGALLVPSSLAIISASFEAEERGRAIGSWTAWTGIAILVGPLIGGLLVDAVSWRLVFAINLPLIAMTLYLSHRAVHESVDPTASRHVDVSGAALCALGLGGVVFALIHKSGRAWDQPEVLIPLLAGLLALAAFLVHEHRSPTPMMPLGLFGSRNFAVANGATLAIYGGLGAFAFFVVVFVQQVADYTALGAGLVISPVTLVMFVASSRFGALSDRVGPRPLMSLGPLVSAAGLLVLLRVGKQADYLTELLPALLLFGIGLSMTVSPLTTTVMAAVDDVHAGVASGVNNAVARIAGLVAIAAVGAVVASAFSATLDERLSGSPLSPGLARAAERAKSRPLVGGAPSGVRGDDRARLERAIDDASLDGFHLGMLLSAGLVLTGGLISALGLEGRRPRAVGPHPPAEPGCAV